MVNILLETFQLIIKHNKLELNISVLLCLRLTMAVTMMVSYDYTELLVLIAQYPLSLIPSQFNILPVFLLPCFPPVQDTAGPIV